MTKSEVGFEALFPSHQRFAARLLEQHLRNQLARDTYVNYRRRSKSLRLIGADGTLPAEQIFTEQNLRRLMALNADKGSSDCRQIFYMYKRSAAFLFDLGLIEPSQANAIAAMRFKGKSKPKRVYLEDEDIAAVLGAIVHKGAYSPLERLTLAAIFLTLLLTGMRNGELCGLELGDLDWDHGQIRVRKAKNDRPRLIGLPKRLEPVLRLYLRHRPASESASLFVNLVGNSMDRDLIVKRFARLSRLSGVHVTAHSCRRSMATQNARKNVPIDAIQAMLGHSTLHMTRAYIQTNVNAVAALMRDW